ncbi:MAG TPA: heat-inducible transcriptional repressor HrcA [Pseudomonadales bacterium]|jgi:heat-inducible transcriptional repressor
MTTPELSERASILLKTLVESYIREGQPVASSALVRSSGLSLSSATVRHVMVDLEERGYLTSPHTSAGRVPTAQGYRFLVNTLMVSPSADVLGVDLREYLNPDLSSRDLVRSASELLSKLTRQAGLVMLPRTDEALLRHVEFLPLSGPGDTGSARVLVILVLGDHDVQNRIIHTREVFSRESLQQAANYINREWVGQPLSVIRAGVLKAMSSDRERIDGMMRRAIEAASQAMETPESGPDYVLSGEAHLLEQASAEHFDRLRDLFGAFQSKQDILHLMDRCIEAQGVQIFIGEESGYEVLDDYSVITAPYQNGQNSVGVLGIVGPTRMAYDRVIPVVDLTARVLGTLLSRNTPTES